MPCTKQLLISPFQIEERTYCLQQYLIKECRWSNAAIALLFSCTRRIWGVLLRKKLSLLGVSPRKISRLCHRKEYCAYRDISSGARAFTIERNYTRMLLC